MKRWIGAGVLGVVVLGGLWFSEPILYVLGAARFQGELLWGRVPHAQAELPAAQMQKLALVPEIKAFGKEIGLSATSNYDRINPTWERTIWNVSACEPLAFENKRWWFPIVGTVPYLGFFTKQAADAQVAELDAEGLDTYARTAGAYSTLGWFEDPLTPTMLTWSEAQLANTILHELAHATVWIPGSVQFNESFANFVGDEASERYLIAKYGEQSEEVHQMYARRADAVRWRTLMNGVFQELDALYDSERTDKLAAKRAIFASLPDRVQGFSNPDRYRKRANGSWNNARMMQYRTYNRSRDWFEALYVQHDRDLLAFMRAVPAVTAGATDPYAALAEAVGADPSVRQ